MMRQKFFQHISAGILALIMCNCGINGNKVTDEPSIYIEPGPFKLSVNWQANWWAESYNLYWNVSSAVSSTYNQITNVNSPWIHQDISALNEYFYYLASINDHNHEDIIASGLSARPLFPPSSRRLLTSEGYPSGFGISVGISENFIIVGTGSESAYIFYKHQNGENNWGEIVKLTASDSQGGNEFYGYAVSISGDFAVVGAYAKDTVYVYYRNHGGINNWGEIAKLTPSDHSGVHFGRSVCIDGDTILVGAPHASFDDPINPYAPTKAGAAYVYQRNYGGSDNWGEVEKLIASDSERGDNFGQSVSISKDYLIVGAKYEDGGQGNPVLYSGAAYIFSRNIKGLNTWVEVAKLAASDKQPYDYFGDSVSISGDYAVVGAPLEDGGDGDPVVSAGAAYLFYRNQGSENAWGEIAKLTHPNPDNNDQFGSNVSINGNILAVGHLIYSQNQKDNDNWELVDLIKSNDTSARLGADAAVSISENYVVVGLGAYPLWSIAYVSYNFPSKNKLAAADYQEWDNFGFSVSINGDTAVIGAPNEDPDNQDLSPVPGAIYIFNGQPGTIGSWGEFAKQMASDAQVGDKYGHSVSIQGDYLIVGAPALGIGSAYIHFRNQGGLGMWHEVLKLTPPNGIFGSKFGASVSVDHECAVVGAPLDTSGQDTPLALSGAAYLYCRNHSGDNSWGEVIKLVSSNVQPGANFGCSVSISGDYIVVGASHEDGGSDNSLPEAGAAYVFYRNQNGLNAWGEVAKLTASDIQPYDHFGASVSISRNYVVVGAPLEDGGDGDPILDTGTVYIYFQATEEEAGWTEVRKIRASDAQDSDQFGHAVSIKNDNIIIGSPLEDGGFGDPLENTGAAYIFSKNTGRLHEWVEVNKIGAVHTQISDGFGYSVSITTGNAIVGTPWEGGETNDAIDDDGVAFIF